MAISIKNTSQDLCLDGVKLLVYGQAGAGKTTLLPSLPKPLIISAEGGLLSILGSDTPYIEIGSKDELLEVYGFLKSPAGAEYQSVALDSISEIAEVVLASEKKASKDPRKAYGEMQDVMTNIVRAFRDLKGKHVVFTAKLEKAADEMGRVSYAPSMPGTKLGAALPYFFDEVLAMRVEKGEDGKPAHALMCNSDGLWAAKDRSGRLSAWEQPDLGAIISKITGKVA